MNEHTSIAERLFVAYQTKTPIDTTPILASYSQAYEIQKCITQKMGKRIGWKIGVDKNGIFVRAPMFQRTLYHSGEQAPRSLFHHCLVESELAFIFRNAMPKKESAYTLAEINANIESIIAGIEICDSRLVGWPDCDPLWQLADSLTHGGYVRGSGIHAKDKNLTLEMLKQAEFKITIGHPNQPPRIQMQNQRNHPFMNLPDIVVWFVNELLANNDLIHSGDLITTGSFSGSTPIEKNETALVVFSKFGQVSINIF